MSDLSNLLGDVYGDHSSPDAAPVRREPAAADRIDLAAGLAAALSAPAPAPAPAPMQAPAPAPAPVPMVDLSVAEAPPAPAWTSSPAPAPSFSVSAPVPAMAGGSLWSAGDDDIFPSSKGSKKNKKK